jgi:alanyl-tRNA synthetase
LHRALRIVLGEDTHQAGSLVAPDRLRFDFTSVEPLGPSGVAHVAELSNAVVLDDRPIEIDLTSYEDALSRGAMALFGEKYGDVVRVVSIPGYSAELCGGAHVRHTGQIGPIVILSEASIGSGIRRIEALTGAAALRHIAQTQSIVSDISRTLRVPADALNDEVQRLQEQVRERDRALEQLRVQLATSDIDKLMTQAVEVDGTTVLALRIDASARDTLLQVGDRLRDKLRSGVVVLGGAIDAQPAIVAMVTGDLTARGLHAGKIIQDIAPIVGGRGGGRPELAQGGGNDISRLDEALARVPEVVKRQVNG